MSPVFFALAVLGCTSSSSDTGPAAGTTTTGPTVFGDCSAEVPIATGLSSRDDDPVIADLHEDVYGTDPSPIDVHLGLPSRDPSTSVSMLWRSDVDTLASIVEIGLADGFPGNAQQFAGYTFLYGGVTLGEGGYRMHEVRLCGEVEPGTTYSYRVGGDGGWSDTYTFSTPGAPGSFDTFRVAIAGDSRGNYSAWGDLVAAAETHSPDLYLFSGDMIELGSNQIEWNDWFGAAGDVLAEKLLVGAHGNHEFLAQHYFAQFGLPGNEEWFALQWGDMLLLTLNDTVRSQEQLSTEQAAFIEEELAATTLPWRVAMHHQSMYSRSTNHESNLTVREAWAGPLEAGGVQLVSAGHNHLYERSLPIKDGAAVADGEGTVHLVSGGAGAELYTGTSEEWWGAVANPIEHYIIGDFGPTQADFVVRTLEGTVIDEFSISR